MHRRVCFAGGEQFRKAGFDGFLVASAAAKLLGEARQDLLGRFERNAVDSCDLDRLLLEFLHDLLNECALASARRTTNVAAATFLGLDGIGNEL